MNSPMRRWECLGSLAILAGLALAETLFAVSAFPMRDDTELQLLALDYGTASIAESFLDRPLAGQIWAWMFVDQDTFYLKAVSIHWMVYFATAVFTLYLARQLFPRRPALVLSIACLAATPFLCRTQIVLATTPIVPGLSQVATFLAIFLIAGTISSRLPTWNIASRWLAAVAALVIGGLISEYFVAPALAGIVWIFFLGVGLERPARMRSYLSSSALMLLIVGIYLVYHQMASAEARENVRPEIFLFQGFEWRAKVVLPIWVSSIYTSCMGAMLERMGSLRLLHYVDVASAGAGTMLAILVHLLYARRPAESEPEEARTVQPFLPVGLILGVALAVLPLVVMGRHPDLSISLSRFWAPIVPFMLCASAGLLASLLKPKRMWVLPPLFALLAGWALVSDGVQEARDLRRVTAWGPEVRQHLGESGICVAIFENGWQPEQTLPREFDLTARLSLSWSPQERQRFCAFANFSRMRFKDATSGIGFDRSLHSPKINRSTMAISRIGPISRVLWIYVSPEGDLQIHAVDAVPQAEP